MWASSARTYLNTLPFDEFVRRFERIFDHPDHVGCVSNHLFRIHRGSRSVAEYAIEFSTLAAESGWDEVVFQAGAQWAGARAITLLVAPCGQKIELVSTYRGVGERNLFLPIAMARDFPGYPVVGAGGTPGLVFD